MYGRCMLVCKQFVNISLSCICMGLTRVTSRIALSSASSLFTYALRIAMGLEVWELQRELQKLGAIGLCMAGTEL